MLASRKTGVRKLENGHLGKQEKNEIAKEKADLRNNSVSQKSV